MTSPQFDEPQLFVVRAEELPLSGTALLELMRAVLAKGLPFRFCARGWSMAPFIRNGDVITISSLQLSKPRIGEIIAFVRPENEKLVVHRVIARHSTDAIFQGDNDLEYPEEVIPQENLLGKVTKIERNGHKVWMGLGPERYMIAWLSRMKLLTPIGTCLTFLLRPGSQGHK